MIVVDLGCYDPGPTFSSLRELVAKFRPEAVYGFDVLATDQVGKIDGVPVIVKKAAASTFDGTARYIADGTSTRLADAGTSVEAFDFSAWLREYGPAVVKMDIEGHEYPLLEKIHADGTDRLIELLIVEWHGEPMTGLRCPVEAWWN